MDEDFTGAINQKASRRGSLFEVPAHFKPVPCGSSITSFAFEPRMNEEFHEGIPKPHRKVVLENTFQMEPPKKFQAEKVKKIIEEVLNTHLEGQAYDASQCSTKARALSQQIKAMVKELDFKRYKIIALVSIGEKKDQDVRAGSRCIWDVNRDTYASASYENRQIWAVGTVYGIYYE